MFLQPKKTKYKKTKKKLSSLKLDYKSNKLKFGNIGIKAATSGIITAKQIEATRRVIVKKINRTGKMWIRIFPDFPVTKKPTEVRMGKGKGSVHCWAANVKQGRILFEVCGIPYQKAFTAFAAGGAKLPIKTTIVF